jgi:hypothetical protein
MLNKKEGFSHFLTKNVKNALKGEEGESAGSRLEAAYSLKK